MWGTATLSNRNIIQHVQKKVLHIIICLPWYVTNRQLHKNLNMKTVDEEYDKTVRSYTDRLHHHSNVEAIILLDVNNRTERRLMRLNPLDWVR